MKPAISLPTDGPVVTVRVRMKVGDPHVFPGMSKTALEKALPKGRHGMPQAPCLSMMNASFAVLSIPFASIAGVDVEDELWWMP